jgi:Pyruvate/2-oxoacid:ferredoxin oxidoreductase delta subunit
MQAGDCALALLRRHHHLKHLDLSGTPVTTGGLKELQGFCGLTGLHLKECLHLDSVVGVLETLQELKHLSLHRCADVCPEATLVEVAACQKLSYLDLSWCKGRHIHANWPDRKCGEHFSALKQLNLAHAHVPQYVLDTMFLSTGLNSLDLSGIPLAAGLRPATDNKCDSPAVYCPKAASAINLASMSHLTALTLLRARVCSLTCLLATSVRNHRNASQPSKFDSNTLGLQPTPVDDLESYDLCRM